jgi:streptomycin 6-kinase
MSDEPLELPRNLVEAVEQQSDPGFAPWVARLPELVPDVAARWDLRVERPFQPGGVGSWTAPARDADGRDLVLKVGWTHDEARHEADSLRLWDGRGAVRLHDEWVHGDTTALLLERARPGVELGRSLPEELQDEVIAGVLRRVWVRPPDGHRFQPLAQMCDSWADSAARTPPEGLDPGIFRAGLDLFRELPRESADDVLLVTDLHAGNLLSAQREPWLLIDPKPYVGDRHYDPLQHLFNCRDRVRADPVGTIDRVADLCGVDRERLRLWLFARWVVESAWTGPGAPDLVEVARLLAP